MWHSAEELRKPKALNGRGCGVGVSCTECRGGGGTGEEDMARRGAGHGCRPAHHIAGLRDCDPKCNIQKQSNMMRQPVRKQVQ